jgi:4-carboxymuconolactone decarboxylase
MRYYLNLALDNGVNPREISEIMTHLVFYSGWENAMVGSRREACLYRL